MKAKTIHGNSPESLGSAIDRATADGYRPNLAVVFVSVKQDSNAITELFRKRGIDVLGATSSGEFTDGHESLGEVVAMMLDLDRSKYRIVLEEVGLGTLQQAADAMLAEAYKAFSNPAFILLSTFHSVAGQVIDGQGLIRHFEETAGANLNLFGGMAGDDITFGGTFVFTHERETDYGLAALVLDQDKVSLRGMAISGWKPVGISRTITKSEGNLIYTIDGKPAFETYLRFLGIDSSAISGQIEFFSAEGVHYPIQIERDGREPMMCAPIGYDAEKGALICESQVPEGSKFRFSTPPDFDIIETVLEKAGELKEQTVDEADAMLIFSCAGRLSALGPLAEQENEGLHKIWGVPMAGFYTYGEFGRSPKGKHDFHSTTNSWVALKER